MQIKRGSPENNKRKARKPERRDIMADEGENSIFCEICGAANADEELRLCPNCRGESLDPNSDKQEEEK
jgi:hypothetical protein